MAAVRHTNRPQARLGNRLGETEAIHPTRCQRSRLPGPQPARGWTHLTGEVGLESRQGRSFRTRTRIRAWLQPIPPATATRLPRGSSERVERLEGIHLRDDRRQR